MRGAFIPHLKERVFPLNYHKYGFVAALNMVRERMSKPNNKEKLKSITNIIDEYGNEGD